MLFKKTIHPALLVIFLLASVTSCKHSVHSHKDLLTFLNQPDNHYTTSRTLNGFKITVKYLPPESIALKETEDSHQEVAYAKALEDNRYSAVFVLTISPGEQSSGDVMYSGISTYKEYVKRSLSMNFDFESKVKLITNTQPAGYAPVLSTMENTYSLTDSRSIYFVFAPAVSKDELEKAPFYDFVYDDDQFGLGLLHFEFNKSDLKTLPTIAIN